MPHVCFLAEIRQTDTRNRLALGNLRSGCGLISFLRPVLVFISMLAMCSSSSRIKSLRLVCELVQNHPCWFDEFTQGNPCANFLSLNRADSVTRWLCIAIYVVIYLFQRNAVSLIPPHTTLSFPPQSPFASLSTPKWLPLTQNLIYARHLPQPIPAAAGSRYLSTPSSVNSPI